MGLILAEIPRCLEAGDGEVSRPGEADIPSLPQTLAGGEEQVISYSATRR